MLTPSTDYFKPFAVFSINKASNKQMTEVRREGESENSMSLFNSSILEIWLMGDFFRLVPNHTYLKDLLFLFKNFIDLIYFHFPYSLVRTGGLPVNLSS